MKIKNKNLKITGFSVFLLLFLLSVFLFLFLFSCQSGTSDTNKTAKDSITVSKDTSKLFEHMLVDNRKDPSCGMPVTAGISDTAHYKDKVLGFCSKECKEDFQKNPDLLIVAAEMKK